MACSFNLEYLLVGGRDGREPDHPYFMWYDWMAGGWGGRRTKDGSNCTAPVFGPGLAVQPLEGQERLSPVLTTTHSISPDSGGPGRHRGGCGVEKGGVLTDADKTVMSYCCDRARSITWGIDGGLPSIPHGVWLNKGTDEERFLGSVFSGVGVEAGDSFTRPSSGGGGYGDPLERHPHDVLEDVIDGYVSLERAAKDYGVVINPIDPELDRYDLDEQATATLRGQIAAERGAWLDADPEDLAARYREGELGMLDMIRQYGVIVDWGSGELLPETTRQFRENLRRRTADSWA